MTKQMMFSVDVDALKELLDHTHPSWSVDRLTCHPQQAIFFCETARRNLGMSPDMPDDEILWPMMNDRKSSTNPK